MAKKSQAKAGKSTLSKEQKLTLYRNLVRADQFDKCFVRRITAGQLVGFYHAGEGGIAPGVAVGSLMNKEDILWPHHRGHALPHMCGKGIDPKYFLAEHCGKETGCCKGRSSYHWSFPEDGVFTMSGFIGHQFGPTVGTGLACQKNGKGQVTVTCFGDGGSGRSGLHDAFLMTNNWKLPVVWVCENNGMAIYAKSSDMHPTENISDLAKGYGMPAVVVDGQDVIACAEATIVAIEYARSGKGPYMIEAKTNRCASHAVGIPDLADDTPRSDEEIAALRLRDPIAICRDRLLSEGVLTQGLIDQIEKEAIEEVAAAEKFSDESPVADTIDLDNIDKLIYAD